jgi:hypothetical protein
LSARLPQLCAELAFLDGEVVLPRPVDPEFHRRTGIDPRVRDPMDTSEVVTASLAALDSASWLNHGLTRTEWVPGTLVYR